MRGTRYSTAGGFIWKYLSDYNKGQIYETSSIKKSVVRINPNDANDIKIYESATYAKRVEGYNQGHISAVCRGEMKSYKGFKWMFLTDYENLKSTMSKNSMESGEE